MIEKDNVDLEYERIVAESNAPTLVLAGPGAGKTYLLADRVTRLLTDGADKTCMTVLAFGKDAAQYMKSELVNQEGAFRQTFASLPAIQTMHSLGFEIVNEKPTDVGLRKTNLLVQDDVAVKILLYRDAGLLSGFSDVESREAMECKARGDCREDTARPACAVCREYWKIMSKCNRLDFDDQILFACRILEKNPELLVRYQARSAHLLVDEYQDINAAQFRMIQLLSASSPEGLFVVGDDAQSIYGFRGATPEFILRFDSDFPGAVKPPLLHSRRRHADIVEAANKILIRYYPEWSGPFELEFHSPRGGAPEVWQLPSDRGEAKMVARLARDCIDRKKSLLVLAPKRDFFRLISAELRSWGVAHECPASLLPRNTELRLHSARLFLKWIEDPEDNFATRLVVEELINRGAAKVPGAGKGQGCSEETILKRIEEERRIASLWDPVDRTTSLHEVIRRHDDEGGTIDRIRISLERLLEDYAGSSSVNQGRFMSSLAVTMGSWIKPANFARDICSAMSVLDPPSVAGDGFAQLMTMKKAKGLQADVVIVVGLEDDMMPNPLSDLAEEARLFYVSMTRAREKLFLFHAYKRLRGISYGKTITKKPRSKFLDTLGIPSEYKNI